VSAALVEQKRAMRRQIRAWRDQIPAQVRQEASRRAAEHLARHPFFARAGTVALFAGLPHELDPLQITALQEASQKRLLLPRTLGGPGELSWHLLRCEALGRPESPRLARASLRPGRFGVLEPEGPAVDPAQVELWVVPGLAFDRQGGRLGYGGGYYDRALAQSRAPRLGFAFARQVVSRVPREAHDLRVDGVMTDSGVCLVTDATPV
jgi:5-formyltetrahydrofolate cyclo-ligase